MGKLNLKVIATLIGVMILMLSFGVKAQVIPEHYIVTFNDSVRNPDIEANAIARDNGFDVGYVYSFALNGFSARIPDRALATVQRDPRVAYVEPDIMMYAFAQTLPTGINRIDAELSGIPSVEVDIAIIDTGIDIDHPELNVVGGTHFYTTFLGLIVQQDDNYDDDNGHGTHVSGTAAAINNSMGVVGVAPGARLWGVKVLDSNGTGYLSAIIAGIDWVTARADIIEVANMSLGGTGLSNSYRTAIANSVAAGIVYVVAAGNNSLDVYGTDGVFNSGSDILPAAYPEVMTVSALADSDGQPGGTGGATSYGPDDSFATFSNYSNSVVAGNPVNSPGKAIDLIMPGVSIYSTLPGGGYGTYSGTSMASPHAAGLVALYIAQNGRANNAAEVYAIRQALIDNGKNQASGKRLAYPLTEPDSYPENLGWVSAAGHYYAVDVLPSSQSDSGVPNDIIQYIYTITNTGTLADTYNISTSGSSWTSSVNPTTILNLGPGGFANVTVSHTIPGVVSNGDDDTGTLNVIGSGASDSATFTTTAVVPGANEMHVFSIVMSGQTLRRKWAASATIKVVDTNDDPVASATVYGTWSGAYNGNVSGATNASGLVTFTSGYVKNGGTFTFTVTNIAKTDWTYNPADNEETSDSITLPLGAPELIGKTSLEAPFPSPGNPEMWIPFRLSEEEQVVIKIYDISGRLIRTLDLGSKPSGAYMDKEKAAYWDGRNNSGEEINSGIYFCVLEAGSFRASKKVLIAK